MSLNNSPKLAPHPACMEQSGGQYLSMVDPVEDMTRAITEDVQSRIGAEGEMTDSYMIARAVRMTIEALVDRGDV